MNQAKDVLHQNSRMLVTELESVERIAGDFENVRLVNVNGGEKKGNFSLVFKAEQISTGELVALKFFDQDPAKQSAYRLQCFSREQKILLALKDVGRCLQLVAPLDTYDFRYGEITIPIRYFITEWLKDDIDSFFYGDVQDPLEKLYLFNEVILSIESLHSRGVFHRDIKVDNFRVRHSGVEKTVVAIDLGTAAGFDSVSLLDSYEYQAGDRRYSSPESICGLAGHRQFASLTDIYALGCLLFELFSSRSYYAAYRELNVDFEARMMAIQAATPLSSNPADQLAAWDRLAPRFLNGLTSLSFEWSEDDSEVPPAIVDLLNRVLAMMTAPNFRNRERSLVKVRAIIRSCIRCLENENIARARSKRAREWRERRRAKAEQRINRAKCLVAGLANGN